MSFTASLTADTFRKLGHVATPFDQKTHFLCQICQCQLLFWPEFWLELLKKFGRILELRENSGTLEEFWNSGRRILEPWKNSGGTLGEFWRNFRRILKKFRKNSLIICFFSKAVVLVKVADYRILPVPFNLVQTTILFTKLLLVNL